MSPVSVADPYRHLFEPPVAPRQPGWLERLTGAGPMRAERDALRRQVTELRERVRQLEGISQTDELTGLANRRGFEEFLRRSLASAARHADGGVLAYLDLDYFKQVNDTHGHQAGDTVLKAVATILKRDTRDSDFVARLHGDEFAILLVRAGTKGGFARLRLIDHCLNNSTVSFGGLEIPLRASMGAVAFGPDSNAQQLLRDADAAMYETKSRPRRRLEAPLSAAA